MSRFRKLTQTIWHCQYQIVWVPKYRYRVLSGQIAEEVNKCIRMFSEQKECEIIELNIQIGPIHLLVMVQSKMSIFEYMGTLKGRIAIRIWSENMRPLHNRQKTLCGYALLLNSQLKNC